jgi:hypothetical protein
MPGGSDGLLLQVIDTGPGLGGRNFQRLFDPLHEMGAFRAPTALNSSTVACAAVLLN